MGLADLIRFQLKRVNPFRGLVVDAPTWAEAHGYHRDLTRLHNLALHRPGIIAGLEVNPFEPPDRSVIIHPGVGVDADGNVVVISERQRYHIETEEAGLVYITTRFREIPTDYIGATDGDPGQASRILEAFMIEERHEPPGREFLELARIDFTPSGGAITETPDPTHPQANHIDLRFRAQGGIRPLGEIRIAIARHGGAGWDRHELGVQRFISALNTSSLYAATYAGPVRLSSALDGLDVVYLTGKGPFDLSVAERQTLGAFLVAGGTLIGDACHETGPTPAREFGDAFALLATSIGRKPSAISRGHPLLSSPLAFATPPIGGEAAGVILEHDGIVYFAGDYGCTWEGWQANAPVPRAVIRDAQDLGINLVAYAADRARRTRLHRGGKEG